MKDIDILKALLKGDHLEEEELNRADQLIYTLILEHKEKIKAI